MADVVPDAVGMIRRSTSILGLQKAWFWTDRWQVMERGADADVAAGRTTVVDGASEGTSLVTEVLPTFVEACERYAADPAAGWPGPLRVKGVAGAPGVCEVSLNFSGPDIRTTFEWVQIDGGLAVRWHGRRSKEPLARSVRRVCVLPVSDDCRVWPERRVPRMAARGRRGPRRRR